MKNLLVTLFSVLCMSVYAQDLPTNPANGYAFPIGSKFTIKLFPVDSVNFDYSVVKYDLFQETVDIVENNFLFPEQGEENTISFYFCLGTQGKSAEERKKNTKIILLTKNYSRHILEYSSHIQLKRNSGFEETSNVGLYPWAKATEMWAHMIYNIGLKEFRIRDPKAEAQ